MGEEVELRREDGILSVTMNRPEKRNAMTSTMLATLAEVFQGLHGDAETRVVVVRGAGDSFSSGLDLREMEAARASSGGVGLTDIADLFHVLEQVPQPTIAMVQGHAIAGGCELSLHCDLRVAAENVRYAMPLARLGIVLPFPLVQKLIERTDAGTTAEMLFTGDALSSEQVRSLHMVNRMVPLADLEETTYALAQKIAANAPLSVRAMKRAIVRANTFRRTIEHEDLDRELSLVGKSEDVAEGVRAMREKRAPRFRGR